ncbi:hypothetical protein MASR2M48_25350 [Spirochaetota bacterium]
MPGLPQVAWRAHCVDAQGVIFAPASHFVEASRLPVLSGLEIRGLWYGLRLEGPFPALLASLKEIQDSNPVLVSAISELRIVSGNTLLPNCSYIQPATGCP